MSATTLITGGRVIDPATGSDTVRDLAVADGVFVDLSTVADAETVDRVDAAGLVVCPGLVDIHVHFREPGGEHKEDIASGTAAAAAGGFTTVVVMPNTIPPIDCPDAVRDQQQRIDRDAVVHTLVTACLTRGRAGRELADLRALAGSGIVAFTDDGNCVQELDRMLEAAVIAADTGIPIVDHCEDEAVMAGGVMRRSAAADAMRLPGMPPETESNMVARNIELSRRTGARLHMQHISTAASVEHLRGAKAEGLPVSCEVTPHHLAFTVDQVPALGVNAKMNPPLGTEDDRQALLAGLAAGTIDAIGTDHAPHAAWEKAGDFVSAPFGVLGLETALPACLSVLGDAGIIDLPQLVHLMSYGPAQVLGLDAGTLAPGATADLAVFDPAAPVTADVTASRSKSRNSPFHGRRLRGAVSRTMCAGTWVYRGAMNDG
jgi:dihydroorotase